MEEIFCIAAFRSRLQVIAFEEMLKRAGIRAEIVTTPRAVSMGCGLSVRFEEKELPHARRIYDVQKLGNLIGFYRVVRKPDGRTGVYPA